VPEAAYRQGSSHREDSEVDPRDTKPAEDRGGNEALQAFRLPAISVVQERIEARDTGAPPSTNTRPLGRVTLLARWYGHVNLLRRGRAALANDPGIGDRRARGDPSHW